MTDPIVGQFPYAPVVNPYQRLFREALESAGLEVVPIANQRWFPIERALRHRIDVLHMDWPHSFYVGRNRAATWIKRWMYSRGLRALRRRPLVWTAHNLHAHDAADRDYDHRMIQRLIDCCDGVVVFSHAAEELLRSQYELPAACRVRVIPHGHYIDVYPHTISREQARRELGVDGDARVVLSLGRMRRYKGLELLAESFRRVARPGDVLVLAGPPEDPDLIRQLQEMLDASLPAGASAVIHPRHVETDRMQVYYAAADVVALPFRHVLNSGSLLLAMSFGRCAVAPRLGSIPEVACPEAYFGYDPEDPAGLDAALTETLACDDLLARGQAALTFARERYDWGAIGQAARSLYEEILRDRPGATEMPTP